MNTTAAAHTVSDLTYADYVAAVDTFHHEATYASSYEGGSYRIVARLQDNTFLVRGTRTNVLLNMRIQRVYTSKATVVFTGYQDNGRDADGIMLDADPSNTFPGYVWVGWMRDLLTLIGK
jgi:hypothetical protein